MKKTVKVLKGTTSVNITLPKKICLELNIKAGDTLLLETQANDTIKITK